MFAGTDIAKEASDIVILDNNFSSIVVAIIYGRNIYDNIRKFLQFQLTVNFCACLLVFICGCIGNETPLTSVQMLWVNLIMDSLGSLALATEPPYEELLQRAPTKRKESIINGKMWKHIIIQALIELILLLLLFLLAPKFVKESDYIRLSENLIIKTCYNQLPGNGKVDHIIYGTEIKWSSKVKLQIGMTEIQCGKYGNRQNLSVAFKEFYNANGGTVHMTLVFNIFVFYTLFNQINCRVIDDSFNILVRILRSLYFPLIILCEMAFQIILVTYGNNVFHCAENGLTGEQWGITFGFSAITFVVSFIIKLIPIDKLIDKYILKKEEVENEDKEEIDIKGKIDDSKNEKNKEEKKRKNNNIYEQIYSKDDALNSNSERGVLVLRRNNSNHKQISKNNNKEE
jgi:Ca2+ transporting ATPase